MRLLHLALGIAGLLIFAAQGQYMAHVLDVPNLSDTERMLYRSAHIYFMCACVANICVSGFYSGTQTVSWLTRLASASLLIAPPMLLLSFFIEINSATIDRPMLSLALYAVFGGGALIATQFLWEKVRNR